MKLHRLHARRHQGGFIQGTILFALAILGVIIAAFAVSNTGSSTNTDTERDRVNAGVILKAGSDLQDAFSRAMGDNWQAANIELDGNTVPATPRLNLYDSAYRYAVLGRLPDQAFQDGTALVFTVDDMDVAIANGATLGAAGTTERVVRLTGLRANVCRRINNLVRGTPWNATEDIPDTAVLAYAAVSLAEGCFGTDADGYTYYRVVAVDAG